MLAIELFVLFFCFYCWLFTPAKNTAPADELPQLPELLEEAAALAAKPVPAVAATLAVPDAVLTLPAAESVETESVTDDLDNLTLVKLRRLCIEHNKSLPKGDTRRIKRAAHLRKAEAIAALRAL